MDRTRRRLSFGLGLTLFATVAVTWHVTRAPAAKPPAPVGSASPQAVAAPESRSRRTSAPPSITIADREASDAVARANDRVLSTLPYDPEKPFIVVDAGAIRRSELGAPLLACVRTRVGEELARVQERSGFDPLGAVERIAVSGDHVVVTGRFDGVSWEKVGEPLNAASHGAKGRVYLRADQAPDETTETLGVWNDRVLTFAPGADATKAALDRLEGRRAAPAATIPAEMRRGHVYGMVPAAEILDVLPLVGDVRGPLKDLMREGDTRAEYHLSLDADLRVEILFRGADAQAADDAADALFEAVESLLGGAAGEEATGVNLDALVTSFRRLRGARGPGVSVALDMETLAGLLDLCASSPSTLSLLGQD